MQGFPFACALALIYTARMFEPVLLITCLVLTAVPDMAGDGLAVLGWECTLWNLKHAWPLLGVVKFHLVNIAVQRYIYRYISIYYRDVLS